jgi:hypothetical protein
MGQRHLSKQVLQDKDFKKIELNFVELFAREVGTIVEGTAASGFDEVGTGLSAFNSTQDITRTGKMGLGEPNPEELFDMIGTPATGSYKTEYTYANGRVVRVQEGGQNILSELGVPAGLVEGYAVDMVNIPNYLNARSYILSGDFSAVAGGRNLQNGMGLSALNASFFSRIQFEPAVDDDTSNWVAKFQVANAGDDVVDYTIRTKGVGADFLLEAQSKLVLSNSEGDVNEFVVTPHVTRLGKGLILNGYTGDLLQEGDDFTDVIGKTGTVVTTIGELSYLLAVDSFGNVGKAKGLKTLNIKPVAVEPAGVAGDIYFNNVSNKHRGHNGTVWNDLY